jgi:hypothetical protein
VDDRAVILFPGSQGWSEALQVVPHDVYHLPGYVAMDAAQCDGEAAAFCYYNGGDRLLLVPLVLRRIPGTNYRDAASPYGYAGPVTNAEESDSAFWTVAGNRLVEILTTHGLVSCFVRLHPLLPVNSAALASVGAVVQHGETVSIDLTLSEEAMWAHMRPNHRRDITRARRLGHTVVIDDWDHVDDFIHMYHETMRRVGATDYYFFGRSYFDALRHAVGDSVHLAIVYANGARAGGGVFFERCGIVEYHLGATHTSQLSEQPTKLMFDEVRRWAKARGNHALHLGGGVGGEGNPLFHFKAGFSRDRHPFHTWRIVADSHAYCALVRSCAHRHPHRLGGYFPAYRRPVA